MNTFTWQVGVAIGVIAIAYLISAFVMILVVAYQWKSGFINSACMLYLEIAAWIFLSLCALALVGLIMVSPMLIHFTRMHMTYNDIINLNRD